MSERWPVSTDIASAARQLNVSTTPVPCVADPMGLVVPVTELFPVQDGDIHSHCAHPGGSPVGRARPSLSATLLSGSVDARLNDGGYGAATECRSQKGRWYISVVQDVDARGLPVGG